MDFRHHSGAVSDTKDPCVVTVLRKFGSVLESVKFGKKALLRSSDFACICVYVYSTRVPRV